MESHIKNILNAKWSDEYRTPDDIIRQVRAAFDAEDHARRQKELEDEILRERVRTLMRAGCIAMIPSIHLHDYEIVVSERVFKMAKEMI